MPPLQRGGILELPVNSNAIKVASGCSTTGAWFGTGHLPYTLWVLTPLPNALSKGPVWAFITTISNLTTIMVGCILGHAHKVSTTRSKKIKLFFGIYSSDLVLVHWTGYWIHVHFLKNLHIFLPWSHGKIFASPTDEASSYRRRPSTTRFPVHSIGTHKLATDRERRACECLRHKGFAE